ncbi:hypothetical protein Hanom_Chr11g01028931 [Helianthus anomalus]
MFVLELSSSPSFFLLRIWILVSDFRLQYNGFWGSVIPVGQSRLVPLRTRRPR